MDILNPPKSYIEFRCAIHRLVDKEIDDAKVKFYKTFPNVKEEILNFFNWLYEARNKMSLPVEKIEIRESDGHKHGKVKTMMIYDIEYWREGGEIKQRKIYIPFEEVELRKYRDMVKDD